MAALKVLRKGAPQMTLDGEGEKLALSVTQYQTEQTTKEKYGKG